MCRACLAQYECALHRAHEARARNGWRCVCRTWFAQVELAHHAYMIAPLYGVPAWLAALLLIQKYTYRQSSCAGLTQLAQKNKTACDMKHFCSLISSNAKAPIEGPYAYKQRLHGSYMHTTACLCDVCAGLHSSRKKWHAQGVARAHTRVVFQSSDYNYFFFKRSQTTAPRGGTT